MAEVLKYFSDRKFPLITQFFSEFHPLLTVEKYCKWYSVYIIMSDGTSHKFGITEEERKIIDSLENGLWYDHAIIPTDLIELAMKCNAKIELQVYDAVCRRAFQDWLGTENVFTREFITDYNKCGFEFGPLYFPTDTELKAVLYSSDITLLN